MWRAHSVQAFAAYMLDIVMLNSMLTLCKALALHGIADFLDVYENVNFDEGTTDRKSISLLFREQFCFCRLITYWPARSMLTHFRRRAFRRNSRRASPVNFALS